MSDKKLTPCRAAGLSRKRSIGVTLGTPPETAKISDTHEISPLIKKKPSVFQKSRSVDQSIITPCRRVGLSRKRKISPFLTELNIATSSPEKKCSKENPTVILPLDSKEIITTNMKDSSNCTISNNGKLSGVFPEVCDTKIQISEVPKMEKKKRIKTDSRNKVPIKNMDVKISNEPKVLINSSENDPNTFLNKMKGTMNFNNSSNDQHQFIKVCYKSEEPSSDSEPLINIKNKCLMEKVKNVKKKFIDDDDDDFETTPLTLSRQTSRTDVLKSEPKKTKKLKKSDSSSSSNSAVPKSCSVTINKIDDSTLNFLGRPNICISDDDFDTPSPKSKEQVRTNVEYLEREIKEKRKILDDMNRAKSMKKLHDVDELKELTSRWKNGCKLALTDLLVELNRHAFMSMEMLHKKFNIPPQFFPLSQ